ncbi:c-Myc-binding protein-like [Pseudoliparis swirei]|uniref:c-Myc-binding protein-like n=1 Tax=Pseudoliparis swirei TaxID=2059687 RepID=UPI0024BD8D0F|nr:c-Myc-binding protein-like [Pseudoliparis swirei]
MTLFALANQYAGSIIFYEGHLKAPSTADRLYKTKLNSPASTAFLRFTIKISSEKQHPKPSNYKKKASFKDDIIMAHYRTPDPKREQFRRYLEKAGVVDSLTSVLVSLYEQPEKPGNALEFVKQHLNCGSQTLTDTEALQQEVVDLRLRCVHLTDENKNLKSKLQRYEPEDGATAD